MNLESLVSVSSEVSANTETASVSKAAIVGMTKALSMEFAERTSSNEVRFAAKDDYGHFCEYPHSSKAEAEQDERLLKSDVWEVFYVTEKTLVGAHDKCIEITFKDGRVSSFEIKTLSDAI